MGYDINEDRVNEVAVNTTTIDFEMGLGSVKFRFFKEKNCIMCPGLVASPPHYPLKLEGGMLKDRLKSSKSNNSIEE